MTMLLQLGSPTITIAAIVTAAVCAAVAWHTVHTARRQSADRVAALAAAIHGDGAVDSFVSEDRAATPGSLVHEGFRPAAIFGVGAVAVLVALTGIAIWSLGAPPASTRDRQPLELARLQYGVTADAFTVSGAVALPSGRPIRGLAVELVTLDRQGRALASSGAPVAQESASSQGQLPFSVSVPYSSAVNRYTIRFRDVSGLRPHVDRRRVQGIRK
jgi:hypothetical protein